MLASLCPCCSCTAMQQDRAGLQEQLAQAHAAAAEGDAVRGRLKSELKQALADRDEAVRLNLKLQVRQDVVALGLVAVVYKLALAWL